jgi:hypothetical protein
MKLGVYVGKHLNFGCIRKVVRGNAMVANRTREIRPSGMNGGLTETWIMEEETGTESGNAETAKPTPKVKRAVLLSRPGDLILVKGLILHHFYYR